MLQSIPVTPDEVEAALKKLKAGKAGADDGFVAEMLKTAHRGLVVQIAEVFSEFLKGGQ